MIRTPAGFGGEDRIKRYLDYYQPSYGVMMLSAGQFSPALLFAAGEQGAWYDPSDFTTMFQDSAGTTPVTAVEQPVGRILDKSGRGNHASQATSASRPVLSARVNLLTYSEDFSNAAWAVTVGGVGTIGARTAAAGTSPIGTTTATRAIYNLNGGTTATDLALLRQSGGSAGPVHQFTVWARSFDGTSSYNMQIINPDGSASAVTVTGTWQKFSSTAVVSSGAVNYGLRLRGGQAPTNSDSADILLWGADLRVTNDGVGIPAYQRVAAATDYDTTGFPYYLRFDGTDDSMATGTITPGIDKVQAFSGVRKLSDAAIAVAAELGTGGAAGSFFIAAPRNTASANYGFSSSGTLSSDAISGISWASPVTSVLTGNGDISGDIAILRVNGTQVATSGSDQGTGNYGNYSLYIGRRAGTSLPFNGRIYSLIIRFGANLDATTISNTETWVNGKTYAYA